MKSVFVLQKCNEIVTETLFLSMYNFDNLTLKSTATKEFSRSCKVIK